MELAHECAVQIAANPPLHVQGSKMLAKKRREIPFSAGLALCAALIAAAHLGCAHPGPQPTEPDALATAFAEFVSTLEGVEQAIRASPSFGSEAERVGGYRHMLRGISKSLEAEVLQDSDYPYFRILDFWLREGGDNPDQRYAFVPIQGGETYRIWGRLGSAVRVEFQIYAGRPWAGTGRSAGFLAFEDLDLGEDGSFEVWISETEREGNWMPNPADATTIFARHVYGEWNDDDTGDIHIDRVGYEGRRRPPETPDQLAQRIENAALMFNATATTWPAFVARRYTNARAVNTVAAPYDTYGLGGAKGRWMSGGHFELAPGKALLLRMPATGAPYQAIQLTDMWFASLEYANQVSSLNATQSVLSPDGAFYYVISRADPGHANWLDPGALDRGTFLLRWDGLRGALAEDRFPSARLIDLEALADAIPGFATVGADQRDRVRQDRRRHLQRRSHR
jgi:hypothetical protein